MLCDHVPYLGFENNLKLENGDVELLLATAYGPRVMYFGRRGKSNVLATIPPTEQSKPTSYGEPWHIYGGHRLWVAPEHPETSYYPDNRPVHVELMARAVRLVQEVEAHSGLEKSISVELASAGSHVTLRHRVRNRGTAPRQLAPWALTAMTTSGRAIFPQAPFTPHPQALAPARPLVLWPFTRMADARSTWGNEFISLRQDPSRAEPQKFGLYDHAGYMAYAVAGQLFIKTHTPMPGPHADFGCNVQTFTNELFLELETLGPLVTLQPDEHVDHEEHWYLFDDIRCGDSDAELAATLAPLLARIAQGAA